MAVKVTCELYKDLGTLLSKALTDAGFETDPDYPNAMASHSDASEPGARDYYFAWNIAYQYFNILHRIISAKPRRVIWSKELLSKWKAITSEQMNAINLISALSVSGESLVAFMSFQIRKAGFEDPLYTEWKIAHLHMDIKASGKPYHKTALVHFVQRTGPVLFVYFTEDYLYLLDIMEHGNWAEKALIEIVHKNWPALLGHYRIAAMSVRSPLTDSPEDIKLARKAGLMSLLDMNDGTVYAPPGGGLTSSRHNSQVVTWADSLFLRCRAALAAVVQGADNIVDNIQVIANETPSELDLELILDENNNPVFFEKKYAVHIRDARVQTHLR